MRSRGVRRRKHKQLRYLMVLHDRQRKGVSNQLLINWQREARRRAKLLGAPAVWRLASDPHIRAMIGVLDPSGNLLADLKCVCAEAVAGVVHRRMILKSQTRRLQKK